MTVEEVLEGGNVNHIVRKENNVFRPIGSWSPAIHKLLIHLEERGFGGAPRFIGMDDNNCEILTFIAGEVSGNKYPNLDSYMWSDETLVDLALLLRRYHDATQGFPFMKESNWQLTYEDECQHEVICHNDAALYNVVFQKARPVAFIDFDMAGPGPRIWDIVYSLYTSVPLTTFAPGDTAKQTVEYEAEMHAEKRRRRISLFFESYGLPIPKDLRWWIVQRLSALCNTLREGAAKGNLAFQKMIEEGHLAHYENEIQFVNDHFEEWL